jgi:hypothetical protein
MRYLLLLWGDDEAERALSSEERRAIVDEHVAFGRRLGERGALVHADALGAPAATVRRHADGKALVTDGPFAETKEQLGGFYVLECRDLEEAVGWAEEVPQSPGLVVEVRQVACD